MKIRLLILFIGISFIANSQAYPYKVYSENGEYFIKSIPFSDQDWTEYGKTIICKSNDTTQVLSTINRYFRPDFLFLSNDGESVCVLMNWFDSSSNPSKDAIYFYTNGVLVRKYKGIEFVDTTTSNSRGRALCYRNNDIDSFIVSKGNWIKCGFKKGTDSLSAYFNTNNSFLKNDTLYLLTHNKFVNRFLIKTGDLIDKTSFEAYSKGTLVYPSKRIIQKYDIKIPIQYGLPKLANGENYCIALAKTAKMVYCHGDNSDFERKYRHYSYEIFCGIDSIGNCVDLELDCKDSVLRNATSNFFKYAKFDKSEIPKGIDRWYFRHIAFFRNESEKIAKQERSLELADEKRQYKIRIKLDSINGIYIPNDLNDCFKSLNIKMSPDNINELKNCNPNDVIGNYHFGLGLWMRNNWGLWNGSRLSIYLINLGIKNPDTMSSFIIISYHWYLNNHNPNLNYQTSHYLDYWEKLKKNNPPRRKNIEFIPPVIKPD